VDQAVLRLGLPVKRALVAWLAFDVRISQPDAVLVDGNRRSAAIATQATQSLYVGHKLKSLDVFILRACA
jgi:hypothetical protein